MKNFLLENGIYFRGTISNFALCHEEIELTKRCNAISYIPGNLLVVRSEKKVYVYLPILIKIKSEVQLCQIATLEIIDRYSYLKVQIKDKVYLVDSNAEARLLEYGKF